MPRLALLNMTFGFFILTVAAAAGAFIATDITQGYLRDRAVLDSWLLLLDKSAHGHSNLFGLLHIAFGLTLPYSRVPLTGKQLQTGGLFLGTMAMGPGMMLKAQLGPRDGLDLLEIALGGMLSAALVALISHSAGLGAKLMQRV